MRKPIWYRWMKPLRLSLAWKAALPAVKLSTLATMRYLLLQKDLEYQK